MLNRTFYTIIACYSVRLKHSSYNILMLKDLITIGHIFGFHVKPLSIGVFIFVNILNEINHDL